MELKAWTPLLDLEREMRGMLDRYWPAEAGDRPLRVTTDMHRDEAGLVVTVEVPGIDPEKDVEILVEADNLVIRGEKTDEREVEEENRYLRERRFGRFERTVALPDGVDADAVTADYDNGVLSVRVPLPPHRESEPHTVPVRFGQ